MLDVSTRRADYEPSRYQPTLTTIAFDANAVGVAASRYLNGRVDVCSSTEGFFNTEKERRTSRATEEAKMRCARSALFSPWPSTSSIVLRVEKPCDASIRAGASV